MLATNVLRNNHAALLELFNRYKRSRRMSPRRKKELFDRIRRGLKAHLGIEEEMLYPALSRRPSPEAGDRLEAVLQDHLDIDERLASLSEMGPVHRKFGRDLGALRRKVEDHLLVEQRGPYQKVRRLLKRQALEELGTRIQARLELLDESARLLS